MRCGFDELPPSVLLEILYNERLGALDLASLEVSSYMFRAASGIEPYRFKSITEIAAHHSCQTHPLFQNFPAPARSQLLARCEGNWKLVLRFLQASQRPSGGSAHHGNNVLMVAGTYHTLLVNENGKLFACGNATNTATATLQVPKAIPLPRSARRITQISSRHNHAGFITETGQVYTFGVGENGRAISQPALVISLQGIPCQQVSTGQGFTVVLTRAGEVYSWGSASQGQLGHGDTENQIRPLQIVEFDESNSVAHISAGVSHTLAVTRSGRLFSWGYGANYCLGHDDFNNELQPKQVAHGGLDSVFIVSAVAGDEHSAAIDSLGQVYTWGLGYCGALGHGDETDQRTPKLVAGLKGIRAVQVEARRRKTFVLADDGTLHAFGWMACHSLGVPGKAESDKVLHPQSLDAALRGHKVASASTGQYHTLVLTRKATLFGFGDNAKGQLGQLGAAEENSVQQPTEVFTAILKM